MNLRIVTVKWTIGAIWWYGSSYCYSEMNYWNNLMIWIFVLLQWNELLEQSDAMDLRIVTVKWTFGTVWWYGSSYCYNEMNYWNNLMLWIITVSANIESSFLLSCIEAIKNVICSSSEWSQICLCLATDQVGQRGRPDTEVNSTLSKMVALHHGVSISKHYSCSRYIAA